MYQEDEVKIAQQIRSQYEDCSQSKLEQLKKLNRKVKKPAEIVAYVFGIVGSLVLGLGMCLAMKVIGNLMPLGIVVGIVGIAMVSSNYFIYKKLLNIRKKKHGHNVIEMADEMLNN